MNYMYYIDDDMYCMGMLLLELWCVKFVHIIMQFQSWIYRGKVVVFEQIISTVIKRCNIYKCAPALLVLVVDAMPPYFTITSSLDLY